MQLLGLLGVVAFSLACAVVGVRLLRVAARTRQAPELSMGARAGLVGRDRLPAADRVAGRSRCAAARRSPRTCSPAFGSVFTFLGYIGLVIGTWRIYRPGGALAARGGGDRGRWSSSSACATVFADA